MDTADIVLRPIGWVRSPVKALREDYWSGITSEIYLDEKTFAPDALLGLADFSHIEVLFFFHAVRDETIVKGSRHPRGNPDWPQTGIFAQRGKNRPNRIGATICRLLSVQGLTIKVQGLDALDGSPVLDVKPLFAEFVPERASIRQPAWSHELMKDYFADIP